MWEEEEGRSADDGIGCWSRIGTDALAEGLKRTECHGCTKRQAVMQVGGAGGKAGRRGN